MAVEVSDQLTANRYEARVDGSLAGFTEYELTYDSIVFTHTEVDAAFEGRGVAGELARQALDDVRRRRLHVVPLCPFIASWIRRHPAYADLVSQS
jgi:predicted GNAT family acetyltransferase